jgi:RNA polymerase sigma-70 factor (ECF subfamily)
VFAFFDEIRAPIPNLGQDVQTQTNPPASRDLAFARMFEAEFGYVWGSIRRLGVSLRDAEDVTHDVFLQVYRKWDAYDSKRPPRPWLFGFAFRAASEYRRAGRRREVLEEVPDAPTQDAALDDALARRSEVDMVERALAGLDFDKRAVLVAYELEEHPMKEIAEALDIPLNTAYSRLRLAREEFAAHVMRLRARRGDP